MTRHTLRLTAFFGLLLAGLMLGGLFFTAPTANAAKAPGTLVSTKAKVGGKTYGQWEAAWWTWATSAVDPLNSSTCDTTQTGNVFLLAGTSGGEKTRTCTIPSGKYLYFPLVNTTYWNDDGTAKKAMLPVINGLMDNTLQLRAVLDGKPLVPTYKLWQQRVTSPFYKLTFTAGNSFGAKPGTWDAIAVGYYAMLTPLTPGTHTLEFGGIVENPKQSGGFDAPFSTNAIYNLTVSS